MTTTYTILSGEGEMLETGLTLRDAAHEVLTSDSREYDVRADADGGFTLWSRQQVANRPWVATSFFSIKTDREAAEQEIFEAVVTSGRFAGHNEAITDEQYAEIQRQFAEEQMITLNELIDRHGANAYIYMDAGNGCAWGEKGVVMDFDAAAQDAYGAIELTEIPTDQTAKAEDGTEYTYISEWIEGENGYRYRVGF